MAVRKPQAKRSPRKVQFVSWREVHWELFRLAKGWRAPREIKVTTSPGRSIWEAGFRDESGRLYRLKTKLRHLKDGSASVAEEGLAVSFGVRTIGRRSDAMDVQLEAAP